MPAALNGLDGDCQLELRFSVSERAKIAKAGTSSASAIFKMFASETLRSPRSTSP
jgi:hypothetical protein